MAQARNRFVLMEQLAANDPPPPRDSLDRKFAVLGCFCIFLAFSFFSYGSLFNLPIPTGGEDTSLEVLTAVFLFLASLLLFAAAKMEEARIRRRIYLLGGLAMAFFCGEELNWGQHVFGFTRPDFLADWGANKNFSIHNQVHFVRSYYNFALAAAPLLLSIVSCAAYFSRMDKIFGIPLPSAPLMLGFLLVIFPEYTIPDTRLWSIFSPPLVLLLAFFSFALFSKQVRLCIFTAALLTMPAAVLNASHLCNCNARHHQEWLEFQLALACLLYAAELWQAQRGFVQARRRLPANLKAFVRRLPPPWLMASALMAAGSSGLAVSAHLASKTAADAFAEALPQIAAVEPSIRSEFDVRLIGNSLLYFKEPCINSDLFSTMFFVHVHLPDPRDLPKHRISHGFDNLDFNFHLHNGMMFDGKCLVKRRLGLRNNRAGTRIITGQYLPQQDGRRLWEAEFSLSQ